jgi:hypothetical protein
MQVWNGVFSDTGNDRVAAGVSTRHLAKVRVR